jgi:hypothetical protein
MATTTPNFGWSVPTSSDLVKNGATAIETLGDSIDASLVDLKGGTTGQVLSKTSNTDMDFTWATSASPDGGLTLITAQTIGSAVSSVTVTGAFSATYENYKIVVSGGTSSGEANLTLQLGSTTTGYYAAYGRIEYVGAGQSFASDNNGAVFSRFGATNTNGMVGNCDVLSPNLAKNTFFTGTYLGTATASSAGSFAGFLNNTTAYTAFTIATSSGTLTGGTIRVYGYKNS